MFSKIKAWMGAKNVEDQTSKSIDESWEKYKKLEKGIMTRDETINKIQRSCAVCKFCMPDPQLDHEDQIICTLQPNNPTTKSADDTCLKHQLRYKNLKIIVEEEHLMEYDTFGRGTPKTDTIARAEKIGADEWQN